ncbi:hypothetical protein AX16_008827 [Volvariella volvacea WC 439]|nr:hypothetical protein AX16_008827 [Volvariella volvacea WC 439]
MSPIKGIGQPETLYDGSSLRIAIIHARWNRPIIDALVDGAIRKLKERGVKDHNIVLQSVPGSFELPFACSKAITGSRVQSGSTVGDLLGGLGTSSPSLASRSNTPAPGGATSIIVPSGPFDAVIAIGVLIKGQTMHFEYISDSVSHGLMKVQLDTGVPVIFGVLTALTDDQALERAGLGTGQNKGHNHGEDWGLAAVEMAAQTKRWAEGKFN